MKHVLAFFLLALSVNAADNFDLQGYLDTAIKAGKTRIVIPPGRYRVAPQHGNHLTFRNLADTEIIATGVEMICAETRHLV